MNTVIRKGLSLEDLEDIHRWLVMDYDYKNKEGLLCNFMGLVKNKDSSWGLFEGRDGYDVCIGFIDFSIEPSRINLLSIDPSYRNLGLGRSLTMFIINEHFKTSTIEIIASNTSIKFWEKLGFQRKDLYNDRNAFMVLDIS